jgi:SAM-dependent methyltransferase
MSGAGWRMRLNAWWDASWFFSEQLEKRLILRALKSALPDASGDLLDLGCGRKPYQALFAGRVRRHIGMDYPPTVSEHMASGYEPPQVDVYGDGLHLPFRADAMDTVLCTQVLEHSIDPAQMMAEITRVLRPGGKLILTAPQEWGLHQEPHDYFRFTRYGLEHLARAHGLLVERIEPRGGFWVMMGQRWSAYLYDSFSRPWRRRGQRALFMLSAAVILPLCALTQLIALGLDRLQPIRQNTLGYLLVATKPERGA